MLYTGAYVNDIILAGKTEIQIQEVRDDLAKRLDIKDFGSLQYFLGMKAVQDSSKQSQPASTENLLYAR